MTKPMKRSSPKNTFMIFYISIISVLASTLSVVFLTNLLIDPYGILKKIDIQSINNLKIKQHTNLRLYKAVEVTRQDFDTLLLGTSRVLHGMDPDNIPFPEDQQVYNLGISALKPYEILEYLKHAHVNNPDLEKVYLGLDFWTFDDSRQARAGFETYRLGRKSLSVRDLIQFNLSLFSLQDSWETVSISQKNPEISLYSDSGFFNLQSEVDYMNNSNKYDWEEYFFKWVGGHRSEIESSISIVEEQLSYLQEIVDYCKTHGIQLTLFSTPIHALQYYDYEQKGRYLRYLEWKRRVAEISSFWDFGTFSKVSIETPSPEMQYFSDTSHFKPILGAWMIQRMSSHKSSNVPEDFGVWINSENVEQHLQATKIKYQDWKESQPLEIETLDRLYIE
ncbi:MAG: hypothetical protein F6K00_13585 [Leptolyngbya sp. SIOISBB]|nr:hypothetical protein [Leptolyngbya sp. SIOISBB]